MLALCFDINSRPCLKMIKVQQILPQYKTKKLRKIVNRKLNIVFLLNSAIVVRQKGIPSYLLTLWVLLNSYMLPRNLQNRSGCQNANARFSNVAPEINA